MTLIILPIRNEECTIQNTVWNLHAWCLDNLTNFKIVLVNDGSTDETLARCKDFSHEDIKVFNNMFDNGKGSALKTGYVLSGLTYAMQDYDDIIFLDGDGQIDPQEIGTLFNIMNLYNADAVIGNKRHKYSMTEYTTTRRIISQTYNFIIKVLFDIKFEDTQCGIKIFKKHVLEKAISKVNVKQYAFDLELIIALRSIKCRIVDAPVTVRRQMNRGSISIGTILRTFCDTIMVWIKMKKRFYSR